MIFDWMKERKITNEYTEELNPAIRRFLSQVDSIKAISNTEGYKEIKRWMNVEREAALKAVMASKEDRAKEKARYEFAAQFIEFLERLETHD